MRKLGIACTIAVACLAWGSIDRALAETAADLRGGYNTDAEDAFVGAGFLSSIGGPWDFNPSIEVSLDDGLDYVTINGDFHYDMNAGGATAVWLGLGPAIVIRDGDRRVAAGGDETDVGMNVFAGLGAKRGEMRPYGQVKGLLSDNSEVSLAFGVRF